MPPDKSSPKPFESKLATGRERYLAQAVEFALGEGWATPEDFLRHFPPKKIIEALANQHALRKELLVKGAKVHEKLAGKKSIQSASEDLEIAVSEEVCTPGELLDILKGDDRVKHLADDKLWAFVTEGDFWTVGSKAPEYDRALSRLVFMIEQALAQNLISLETIGDALTFDDIATLLPPERLQDVVRHALAQGRSGRGLTEEGLLSVVPLRELVSYFELEQVWNRLIAERIAVAQGFTKGDGKIAAKAPEPKKVEKKPAPVVSKPPAAKSPPVKPPPATKAPEKPAEKEPAPGKPDSAPPTSDEDPRVLAEERLRELGRLPPNHEQLSLPVLLSIDSMYAELDLAESDEEREELMRDSFPNESHLRQAMLALIELLDPSIDTKDSLIKDAEIDSLIKIVLFEERRRR